MTSIFHTWLSVVGSTVGGVDFRELLYCLGRWMGRSAGGPVPDRLVILRMALFIRWYCSCGQQFHGSVGWWRAVRTQCRVMSLWSCFLVCVGGWAFCYDYWHCLLALDQLCKRSVCWKSVSLLCRIMITGTVTCTGTNREDVACTGRNYVALVGLLHL